MVHRKDLLDGDPVSYTEAFVRSDDILHKIRLPEKHENFRNALADREGDIKHLVRWYHDRGTVTMSEKRGWTYGRHNVFIPIDTYPRTMTAIFFRVSLPYRVGEERRPGNADEKVRCDVATYIWICENCPGIPIPKLRGFGFEHGGAFADPTGLDSSTWIAGQNLRRQLGLPLKFPFVEREKKNRLGMPYMFIDRAARGRKLSDVIDMLAERENRVNFLSDLADIMLQLRSKPMQRIGSLTVRDGKVNVANRPLTQQQAAWDNEGIPTISRGETFDTVESYITALLECHDNAIRCQENAIRNLGDGQSQLSNILMMRALSNQFIGKRYRKGPFILTLTNLQPHNIWVRNNGHIQYLIDLDWACSLPVEMMTPPYWLVDLAASNDPDFGTLTNDFLNILQEREHLFPDYRHDSIASVMRSSLQNGSFWYFRALQSPDRVCQLFREHIQGRYWPGDCSGPAFKILVSRYWCPEAREYIQRRIADRVSYNRKLRAIYMPHGLGSRGWRCQQTFLRDLCVRDPSISSRYDVMML